MIIKMLGVIDIISALIILFNVYNIHWIITNLHVFILMIKGLTSIVAGPLGIAMGLTDIIAAMFIMFAITGLFPIKIILFMVLIYKGSLSLI